MLATTRRFHSVSRLLAILPLFFVAGGCVLGTREPLYDVGRDVAFDPRLLGTWRGPDGIVDIARGPGRSYRITSPDADSEAPGTGLTYDLVPLGRKRYLFAQSPGSGVGTMLYGSCRVRREHGQLCLRALDVFALEERLQRQPGTLRYETVEVHTGLHPVQRSATGPARAEVPIQNLILTDSPKRIRQYLIRHENDRQLFPTEIVLARLSSEGR